MSTSRIQLVIKAFDRQIAENASAATGPLGCVAAVTLTVISAPTRSATSMNAAIGVRIPLCLAYASCPHSGPPSSKAANGVAIGENVFVS